MDVPEADWEVIRRHLVSLGSEWGRGTEGGSEGPELLQVGMLGWARGLRLKRFRGGSVGAAESRGSSPLTSMAQCVPSFGLFLTDLEVLNSNGELSGGRGPTWAGVTRMTFGETALS